MNSNQLTKAGSATAEVKPSGKCALEFVRERRDIKDVKQGRGRSRAEPADSRLMNIELERCSQSGLERSDINVRQPEARRARCNKRRPEAKWKMLLNRFGAKRHKQCLQKSREYIS